MPEPTVTKAVTAYEISVGDFFVDFWDEENEAYEGNILRCPEIKTLNIEPDASDNKIYASGKVRDVLVNVRGAKLGLTVVALPAPFLKKAQGVIAAGNAVSYEKSVPKLPTFGCGFTTVDADDNEVYYWFPNCKLTMNTEEHATSDDSDADPSVEYEIQAMPTDENVWRVRYRCADVPSGSTPLTANAFFAKEPRTIAQIEAIET